MTETDTYDDIIVIYIACRNGHWSPVMGNKAKRSPSVLSSGWALPKALTSESCLLDSHLHLFKNRSGEVKSWETAFSVTSEPPQSLHDS